VEQRGSISRATAVYSHQHRVTPDQPSRATSKAGREVMFKPDRATSIIVLLLLLFGCAFAFTDFQSTVGIKSFIIGLVPISYEKKADLINGLCERALPAPLGASSVCLRANAKAEWIESSNKEQDRNQKILQLCSMVKEILSGKAETSVYKVNVLADNADSAMFISGNETYVIDKKAKSISTFSGKIFECREW
jgi:hypothetical protein